MDGYGKVAGLDGGGFVVTWATRTVNNGFDVAAQIFNANGVKFGNEITVNTILNGNKNHARPAPASRTCPSKTRNRTQKGNRHLRRHPSTFFDIHRPQYLPIIVSPAYTSSRTFTEIETHVGISSTTVLPANTFPNRSPIE